jgi:hypothetical protein
VTLAGALSAHGLQRVDWLKCDTQGLDLSLFLSLPEEWRRRVLAVEFEPGLIDAYDGEDKFWRTLQMMEGEPYWICDLQVGQAARGERQLLTEVLGAGMGRWLPRLVPTAPAYVNVRYLRQVDGGLSRRELLLSWVFADLLGQHAHALRVARDGLGRSGGGVFEAMHRRSTRRLQFAMLRKFPRWMCQRLGLPV